MRRRAFFTGMEDGMSKARQKRQVWPLKRLSAQIHEPRLLVRLAQGSGGSWAIVALEESGSWAKACGRQHIENAMVAAQQKRRLFIGDGRCKIANKPSKDTN